ncbi:MAG TPA: ribosome maturation factor RimP [Polyangiaceae bacterium]
MLVAHEKLLGLDRERVLAAVLPVLRAHHVEGVELLWRTDRDGRVLELTVEHPTARRPGEGITVELCSEISRDLSTALDVADVIPGSYRLEVGSPGLERALYRREDYARFAGQRARLRLATPLDGQRSFDGVLHGVDDTGGVLLETGRGLLNVDFATISSARLVFEWGRPSPERASRRGTRRPRTGRGQPSRAPKRST